MKCGNRSADISRRNFLKLGGAAAALSTVGFVSAQQSGPESEKSDSKKIKSFRRLGRTEFKVSDISMGTTRFHEGNVVRYAYDHGVNYFDTAEGYGNGESERLIGQNMQYMQRDKIFITTKLHIDENETEKVIIDRFSKCQQRLQTEYVDCLFMHGVRKKSLLIHTGFHSAVRKLRSEGRLRFAGISSHGPRRDDEDSMEVVLTAAANDGRFDVMLLVYNFLNKEAGEKILAACKKNDVGTTAMKISPGFIKVEPFDPDNPTTEQKKTLQRLQNRGMTEKEAIERLLSWTREDEQQLKNYQPFFDKYGISSEQQLRKTTIQWVLTNEHLHTACISMRSFDTVDQVIPVSGTKLSSADSEFLKHYGKWLNNKYCRHACSECLTACPGRVPVSTIMRYAYYFELQGNEKLALEKYRRIISNGTDASACIDCDAPCIRACPYNLDVQAHLYNAHSMLSLA